MAPSSLLQPPLRPIETLRQSCAIALRALVPKVADGCTLDLHLEGTWQRLGCLHRRPGVQAALCRHTLGAQAPGAWQLLESGETLTRTHTSALARPKGGSLPQELLVDALLAPFGKDTLSVMVLPLRTEAGRGLGIVTLYSDQPTDVFDPSAQQFAERLLQATAAAVEPLCGGAPSAGADFSHTPQQHMQRLSVARKAFAAMATPPDILDELCRLLVTAKVGVAASLVDFRGPSDRDHHTVLAGHDEAGKAQLMAFVQAHPEYLAPPTERDAYVEADRPPAPGPWGSLGNIVALPLEVRRHPYGQVLLYRELGVTGSAGAAAAFFIDELLALACEAIDRLWLGEEVQEAVIIRDNFLSIASHELRTPLTALNLQLENLARFARRQPDGAVGQLMTEKVARAFKQTGRLMQLIDNLLDVVTLRAGPMKVSPALTEISMFCRAILRRWANEAARAGCDLRVHCPDTLTGMWDSYRMEQVFDHLLANAIKYGAGRPIELTVSHDDTSITLTLTDGGIGIAPNAHERIFGEFERAVSPREFGGLGLGLYLSRGIIEAHGGRMDVLPTAAHGAIFQITLPKGAKI
jgi:signal transduction histidine kinase